eukprot:4691392-Alexandrium_andersonii.AAC.1
MIRPDEAALAASLHRRLLHALSRGAGRHLQGMQQASRVLRGRVDGPTRKRLVVIDGAFAMLRH